MKIIIDIIIFVGGWLIGLLTFATAVAWWFGDNQGRDNDSEF